MAETIGSCCFHWKVYKPWPNGFVFGSQIKVWRQNLKVHVSLKQNYRLNVILTFIPVPVGLVIEAARPYPDESISCDPPTMAEVHAAITRFNNGKSPGICNIPLELLKGCRMVSSNTCPCLDVLVLSIFYSKLAVNTIVRYGLLMSTWRPPLTALIGKSCGYCFCLWACCRSW